MTPTEHQSREPVPGDFDRLLRAIIERSVRYRAVALPAAFAILLLGLWSAARLPLDVTPDISNVQVQILTPVSALMGRPVSQMRLDSVEVTGAADINVPKPSRGHLRLVVDNSRSFAVDARRSGGGAG